MENRVTAMESLIQALLSTDTEIEAFIGNMRFICNVTVSNGKYEGRVNGCHYGQDRAKRATAVRDIVKRVSFETTRTIPAVDNAALTARDALNELNRRAKEEKRR